MNPPLANPLPRAAATIWNQRYEDLRQLALRGNRILGANPLGLVLLHRQGVAGWMRSWPTPEQTAPRSPAPTRQAPMGSTSPWQQELTILLAEMSLAGLK
jgi:hypothetical protein